jgi:hypothetical protein
MTRRTLIRRRHRPLAWLALGLGLLLAVDAAACALWLAWHLLPWLLVLAATVIACKRWQRQRRALAPPLRASIPAGGPVVGGYVVADDADRLRGELARVRGQVTRLEDAANRPIEAIIASYERISRQYGDAAVGRTGVRK